MFFIGFPLVKTSLTVPSSDFSYITGNLKNEIPAAFNLGLNESNAAGVMMNFSHFINESMYGRSVNFSYIWVFSTNISTDINVTAGNYLGFDERVNLTISSAETELFVPYNKTNSTTLSPPGTVFNITIEYIGRTTTVEWLRDKANLFAYFQLQRGGNIVKEELAV